METSILEAVGQGLQNLLELHVLLTIVLGVAIGTVGAVTPQGFGTPLIYAMLLPVVVTMQPIAGIALLVAIGTVSSTCAAYLPVLFGVPGGAGSQSTVLDGHPMGLRGEARRALGAAFTAGFIGTVITTLALATVIPIAQPLVLLLGSPELFVIVLWGLSMVAVLSGREPLKGLVAAAFGLLLGMVGQQEQSGLMRYVFGEIYLLDGFSLSLIALALFGVPAALNLFLSRIGVEKESAPLLGKLFDGVRDALRNWWLIFRCSFLGIWVGIVPGLGAQVVDWLAYGHAAQTCKGAKDTFGKGDVRGVIAPESANDAKDGGDYMTTLLLGFPQGTSTALFIVALLALGFVPGPEMLRKHSDVIFSIVWTMGIANVIGTLIGFGLANQLAKIAQLRYGLLVSIILTFVLLGGFSANRDSLDLLAVFLFGFLGYWMWRLAYPRPALILGLILGSLLEKYLYRSVASWGFSWLGFPSVIILLVFTLVTFAITLWSRRERGPRPAVMERQRLTLKVQTKSALTFFFLAMFLAAAYYGWDWPLIAKLMPVYWVALPGAVLAAVQLAREFVGWQTPGGEFNPASQVDEVFSTSLDRQTEIRRTASYFGWYAGGALSVWLLGMSWGLPLWVFLFTRFGCGERWHVSLFMSAGAFALLSGLFEHYMGARWPRGFLFQ